jgi:hydroxysqualene synthase
VSVDHYENFPVASWLCPPALRPTVKALYWFARTADDLADEGDAPASQRLAQLSDYRQALELAVADRPDPQQRWPEVFLPLRQAVRGHGLDARWLHDLLSAFEQDVHNPLYADRAQLLDYCSRSANPVGRLLLQLYGVDDARALQESDAVCTALQLINFWQDIGRDLARGRCYVPRSDAARHGVDLAALRPGSDSDATRALLGELCQWSEDVMRSGAGLVHQLPGRAGWELRLVVQGGLRVLERIRRMHHATLVHRPTLSAWDAPLLMLRAVTMRPSAATGACA